eukprot:SAG31_NODE_154_length_22184_cov_25.917142_14_plen_185_part_00
MVLHRYAQVVTRVPFFIGCREDAIVDICQQLQTESVMPGDPIIEHGDPYRELVILTRGAARSVPEMRSTLKGDAAISPRASMQQSSPNSPRFPAEISEKLSRFKKDDYKPVSKITQQVCHLKPKHSEFEHADVPKTMSGAWHLYITGSYCVPVWLFFWRIRISWILSASACNHRGYLSVRFQRW